MSILIRRSNLLVPVLDEGRLGNAWRSNADAVTIDLENTPPERRAEAEKRIGAALEQVRRGGAEAFVRVDRQTLEADLAAAVRPGLNGIMLPRTETADDVAAVDARLSELERARGLALGSLELIVLIETALGVWNLPAIMASSRRISQAGLDEGDLAASMRLRPQAEYDPFIYARGRLVIETVAAGIRTVGMAYPLSVAPRLLPAGELLKMANLARNMGMKGTICPHESWVEPVNAAFTPTADLVAYNRRVREVFAAGVAAGTAAVPLDGRMIDVPVDEWAKVVIATAEACAARDAHKREALARNAGR